MRKCSLVFALAGALLMAGCTTWTRPDGDSCGRKTSGCSSPGVSTVHTQYDVSWDKSCADYPVSSRKQYAEEPEAAAEPPRQQRAEAREGGKP